MTDRNRQLGLPRIKRVRVYTEESANRFKSLRKISNSASVQAKTESIKEKYLCSSVCQDPCLAGSFNCNYRPIELDVSHVRLSKHANKFYENNTCSQKELSSIKQKTRKRRVTPSVSTQISQGQTVPQAQIYLEQYVDNYKTLSQSIRNFIDIISQGNELLRKTSVIVIQSLLKLGKITVYQPGQIIYSEKQPVKMIGLVLWGQAILKRSKRAQRFSVLPGYAIGEELIFQKKDYHQNMPRVQKGQFLATQKCKAYCNCGMLLIDGYQYNLICQQLAREGYKDVIGKFESLLLRTYLKKREFRHTS